MLMPSWRRCDRSYLTPDTLLVPRVQGAAPSGSSLHLSKPMYVTLTQKQTDHVYRILKEYERVADERGTLPPLLLIKIKALRSMIEEDIGFDDTDFAFLATLLQLYFEVFDEDDIDPLAEQAFAKCTGEWYILPPWHDRAATLSGSHDKLGT